jgi:hypothetical protein
MPNLKNIVMPILEDGYLRTGTPSMGLEELKLKLAIKGRKFKTAKHLAFALENNGIFVDNGKAFYFAA